MSHVCAVAGILFTPQSNSAVATELREKLLNLLRSIVITVSERRDPKGRRDERGKTKMKG